MSKIDFLALVKQVCNDRVNVTCSLSSKRSGKTVIQYVDIIKLAKIINHHKIYDPITIYATLDCPISITLDGRMMARGAEGGNESAKYIRAFQEMTQHFEVNCYFDGSKDDTLYFVDEHGYVANIYNRT